MDTSVFRQGETILVTVPASSQISVWTNGKALVFQRNQTGGGAMGPKVLLATVQAGTPYLSGILSSTVTSLIEVDCVGEDPVRYQIGVSPFPLYSVDGGFQPVPSTLDATGALTIALLSKRIVTSSTAAAVAGTLDTGTVMDAAMSFAIGDSFDWTLINTGPNTFTVTAAAGHTIVGVAAVVTVTSATFRTKKTAANTFVTYRLAG